VDTYTFCASLVAAERPARALDYGCGAGKIVGLLRAKGIDAHGCDVYYDGGDVSGDVPADLRPYIQRMEGGRIPFPDHTFDVVCSNFVLEHIPDLRSAAAEMARVLRPGGVMVHLFPDKSVWREGHCELPFLHWFPRGKARVYYAAGLYRLGMGAPRSYPRAMDWARHKCTWLDRWTHYRSMREVHEIIGGDIQHLEHVWFDAKFGLPGPESVKRWIVRKLAGAVMVCRH
jgi:SAM-dependent methyltransferase